MKVWDIYIVNKDCEYSKDECSLYIYIYTYIYIYIYNVNFHNLYI